MSLWAHFFLSYFLLVLATLSQAVESPSVISIDTTQLGSTNKAKSFCRQLGHRIVKRPPIHQRTLWTDFRCVRLSSTSATHTLAVVKHDDVQLKFTLKSMDNSNDLPGITWLEDDHFNSELSESDREQWLTLLVTKLLQQSPALFALTFNDMQNVYQSRFLQISLNLPKSASDVLSSNYSDTFVPRGISLFRLRYNKQGVWIAQVIGRGTILNAAAEAQTGRTLLRKGDSKQIAWQMKFADNYKPRPKEIIFAQSTRGIRDFRPQQKWGDIPPPLSEEGILKTFVDRLQVGVRGGMSLVRDSPLLKKSKIFGLLCESKAGWSDGLRLYYDFVPKVRHTDELNLESSIYSSRIVGGWAINFQVSEWTWGLVDSFDLTPKVGAWSFDTTLPVGFDDGTSQTSSFEVKRAFSLGVEIGLSATWKKLQPRIWYGSDLAGMFSKKLGGTQVNQNRYGADILIPFYGGNEGENSTIVSLMLFAYGETINLKKTNVSEEESVNSATLNDLQLSNAYLGLGFVIAP